MTRLDQFVVAPVRAGLRWSWRRRLVATARDVTTTSARRSALVIAPHPDDESLGCGAMIHRKTSAGTRVVVVAVADGRGSHPNSAAMSSDELVARRADELRAAAEVLGIAPDDVHLLGIPDGTVSARIDEVARRIDELVRQVDPDEVLVTSELDAHDDHRAVNEATRRAPSVWDAGRLVATYPVWSWREGPWTPQPGDSSAAIRARRLVTTPITTLRQLQPLLVRTDGHLDAKRTAIAQHRSQVSNLTGEADWATFPPGFVEDFCGPVELLFEVPPAALGRDGSRAASRRMTDGFDVDVPIGDVPGSRTVDGDRRGGVDRQDVIGVDHGAARIRPLRRPGWGRAVLSWGPWPAEPGLVMVAHVLNGHNASQTYHIRLPWRLRLRRFVGDVLRRRLRLRVLRDNLAIGWYPRPDAGRPDTGSGFVMRSAGTTGGELRTGRLGTQLPVVPGVQNVPITYVVSIRPDGGTSTFVGSVPGAVGFAEAPALRPVGIDPAPLPEQVHAVVQQAVLGEIGFRVDTRVYGVEVWHVPELAHWCQTAHAAARDPLTATVAERGGAWQDEPDPDGGIRRLVDPGDPSGLLHVRVRAVADPPAGLVWRAGPQGAWSVRVGKGHVALVRHRGARLDEVATARIPRGIVDQPRLQVVDDGTNFAVHLDDHDVFGRWFDAGGLDGTAVGVVAHRTDDVRDVEAHALHVRLPTPEHADPGLPPVATGDRVVIDEHFTRPGGLADHDGDGWVRSLGTGRIVVEEAETARVDASIAQPNPDRTFYTLPWTDGLPVDVAVTVTPAGTRRGQGHGGRTGVVLWQDEDNYLVVSVWLDDSPGHDGSSVSSFLRSRGHEEPYEAVWTNVGRGVDWGVRHELRVSLDAGRWTAWLDGRPVLHRAIADVDPGAEKLDVTRVGLAVNWEYGNDTGSVFHTFVARTSQEERT